MTKKYTSNLIILTTKKAIYFLIKSMLVFAFMFNTYSSNAQCPTPTLYDGSFVAGTNPIWLNCINLAGSPDTFQVTFGSPNDITTYTINFGDGFSTSGVNWTAGTFINHTYANLGTYTVTLTETDNGCPIVITGTVINERTPTAGIIGPAVGQNAGCAPHNVCFGNNSFNVTASTVFTWDFGDGNTEVYNSGNAGQTVCHVYDESAAACGIVVSLTATNNCGTSTTTWNPVDIFKPDVAEITPDAALLCYPDTTVEFTNTSTLNCISGVRQIYWDFGDGTTHGWTNINIPITHSFPGIGTYTIMMVDSNACGPDTAYSTVTIVAPPIAGIAALNDTICKGDSITFINNSTGAGNLFTWNYGDGNSSVVANYSNQTHQFNTSGNFTVSILADISGAIGACTDVATVDVVVLEGPNSNFNLNSNQACDSLLVNITELTSGAISWHWDFGNGDTSNLQTPPSQLYNTEGKDTISLITTSNNGCETTFNQVVTINKSPTALFNVFPACISDTAFFQDISTIVTDSIISWAWNFGDGFASNDTNPTHIYTTGGLITASLTINTLHCSSSKSEALIIDSLPTASFIPDNLAGCTDLPVNFSNNSVGATKYTWEVNGVQSDTTNSFNHIFSNSSLIFDSIYAVHLIAETSFGCADDTIINITVHPLPIANFSSDASPQCSPLVVNFTNASINFTNSKWKFNTIDSSISTNPSYTFTNNTLFIETYPIQLIVESSFGCLDTIDDIVTVYPKPEFNFQSDSGCGPLPINFNANAGAVIYDWDFGDGGFATGANTNHTFTNTTLTDTNFLVQLIATSSFNCTDTTTKNVTVYALPDAAFSATPLTQTLPNSTVMFTNSSVNASVYTWRFGDSTSFVGFEPDSHVYNTHGVYEIVLIAENAHCSDSISINTTINPTIPIADFFVNEEGCRPVKVTVQNNSVFADSYHWDFGDGGTSTQQNPTYTYYNPGTFTVSLTATGAGGTTIIQKSDVVIVHDLPEAAFTANPLLVHLPDENVNFYNLSLKATDYLWDFGDGNTSTEKFAAYVYKDLGEFEVLLIASNEFGCSDTATEIITTIAGGNIVVPNAFSPSPAGPNGGVINGDGLNDVFYAITEGITTFKMEIFNRWGELMFVSNDHNIGWDGYYKGVLSKQDVYVYKIFAEFENGETEQLVGDITLLR